MNLLRLPALLTLLVLLLVAAGCGSESEGQETGVASLETDAEAALGDAASAQTLEADEDSVDSEQAALDFSACMRDEGLDFADVGVDADGRINLRAGFEGVDRQSEEFRSAMEQCRPLIESAGFGGGDRAAIGENVEIQDALVEFSSCVREAGYDVGDVSLERPEPNNNQTGAAPESSEAGAGSEAGEGPGQGQRGPGFGNRTARFANQLGLDSEDPEVIGVIEGCMPIVDDAFASAGIGQR